MLMRAGRLFALCVLCGLAAAGPWAGATQSPDAGRAAERSIKAAYLYKFADYVEWPDQAQAGAPLQIGVLGSAPMADELARITGGRPVGGRPVQVRRVDPGDPLAGLHVLFIGDHDRGQIDDLLLPTRGLPILTVTESAGALADGSVINFTVERERVRFEVSLPAAERNRLKLSSRLLSVAQRVER